jgi:hypothetical protein
LNFFCRAPFLDENLYAEAGAMRIPSAHPLVNELIDVEGLADKKRLFYNSDVDRFQYVGEKRKRKGEESKRGSRKKRRVAYVLQL